MTGQLEGKIALVTGAAGGIGGMICRRLSQSGAMVVLLCHSRIDRAMLTVLEIEGAGGRAFAVAGDIAKPASIDSTLMDVERELHSRAGVTQIDILVNNAGINVPASIEETTEADFDRIMNVNFKGPFFMIQKMLPRIREGGRIINISSAASMRARPRLPVYGASKAALNVLTRTLAAELGPRRITVNAIAPGMVQTDMNRVFVAADPDVYEKAAMKIALGRVGQPDDIADIVAFLAGPSAEWINGQVISADGGQEL